MTTIVERVAYAVERFRRPQWTDEQFKTWWFKDSRFTEYENSWGHFHGTQKELCLREARIALEEAGFFKLLEASKEVEEWWLTDGMHNSLGAPHAIFATRAAIKAARRGCED